MGKVVIVDDEKDIADLIALYLKNANYEVEVFYDSEKASSFLKDHNPSALILDIMMPKMDGFTLLKELRENSYYPVIIVSAKSDDKDVLKGLVDGADDYITKPFNPMEIVARLNALLRRVNIYEKKAQDEEIIEYKELIIEIKYRKVILENEVLDLTTAEYIILKELLDNQGHILSTEELFKMITGDNYYNRNCNSVAVHIRNLRIKMKDNFGSQKYIKTAWGRGYWIE